MKMKTKMMKRMISLQKINECMSLIGYLTYIRSMLKSHSILFQNGARDVV